MDNDGYPDDDEIKFISEFPYSSDARELFAYIKPLWQHADFGYWSEEDATDDIFGPVRRYEISTAGWSGNESIISAMQENFILWSQTWVQSRRGGHYIFQVTTP